MIRPELSAERYRRYGNARPGSAEAKAIDAAFHQCREIVEACAECDLSAEAALRYIHQDYASVAEAKRAIFRDCGRTVEGDAVSARSSLLAAAEGLANSDT